MSYELWTAIFAGVVAAVAALTSVVVLMRVGQLAGKVIERMDEIKIRVDKLYSDIKVTNIASNESHREMRDTIGSLSERVARVEVKVDALGK
jgi:uncharacterized protein YoxC